MKRKSINKNDKKAIKSKTDIAFAYNLNLEKKIYKRKITTQDEWKVK